MSSNLSSTKPETARLRPRRACDECRKRKRKCDGELPCTTCTHYEYTCQYEYSKATRRSRAVNTSLQTSPTDRLVAPRESFPADNLVPTGGIEQQPSFLDRGTARFISHASSISQARSLGLGLGLPEPPRLHSFGYHTGVRKEPERATSARLPQLLPWDKARDCIDVFTAVIHPVFGLIDMESICQRAREHWQASPEGLGFSFDAVISGIVALGSLFSNLLGEEKELQVVLHAKALLDDPVISRRPSQDLVVAWILRTIYSRATSRPNVAWLHSSTTMNLIEITGIHYNEVPPTYGAENTGPSPGDEGDERARITSVAQSLHVMIAYDYGKTITHLDPTACDRIQPRPGDYTLQLSELTNKVFTTTSYSDPISNQAQLLQAMEQLMETAVDHDFLILARAELCFAIHRRLRVLGLGLTGQQIKLIVAAGTAALPAARRLSAQHHPWWNITNALFQFICACLSVDTNETLANIQPTVETFESVTRHFNTHLTREAFNTALLLINACQREKEKQVSFLQLRGLGQESGPSQEQVDLAQMPMIDSPLASLFETYHEPPFIDLQTIFNI
ncbi:hypothetical protein N7540_009043 [Penicillium herquei]|nr:hypothetical protein N7540_009043 [Penicillium herquei]